MKVQSIGKQVLNSAIFSAVLIALTLVLGQVGNTEAVLHRRLLSIVIFSAFLGLLVAFMAGWGLHNMSAQSRPNLFLPLLAYA